MGVGEVSQEKRKAVFFDRDGVLNETVNRGGKPCPPYTLEELVMVPDGEKALKDLKKRGFLLIGATNQPDVARGTLKREMVEAINERIMKKLPLQEIRVCYHDDRDHCQCRKPGSGMLLEAGEKYDINFSLSYMIGDRWKDILAGEKVGCKTIFINHNYKEKGPVIHPDFETTSLIEAVEWILSDQEKL